MFRNITLRGLRGAVLRGYVEAAVIRTWTITKREDAPEWILSATCDRIDPFHIRQRGLLFSAPRHRGFWAWPVQSITVVNNRLSARLGPPEY